MSERLLDHSLRLIAYIRSQAALGVPVKDIENAIKSTSIEQLEADAAAKAAAAATAPSGTPSTPPTLPASPPLGTPPTPPALPTSGTPPTLPALPTSGTPPTLPALPPSGTPGSSSFNNWYEEIAVSRLSNSTPSDVQAPTLDQPGINNVTNTTVTDAPSSTPSEIQTPDLGAPNAPQSNNSILLETCSVNENHNTNYGFCLPESSKASTTVLPTGSIKQWFYKDPLLYWIQINTQTQTSNSKALILLSSVDISTNHTKSGSNNITNSTNVTTLSETHSTTPFEVQTPALDQPGINNVTNTTVTDAPNALQSNNSTLLKTCSVNENHNTNYGFYLPEFSKALTVLHTGAIKQGFYKPSQTNTASSLNTPSDYNTNSLFNSFQVNTQTQTSNSTPFIHIYDLIKNAPSSKFNNITNSTNFTNSNDLPTNNTESDHDSFTSNNLYKLLGDTSSHLNSNIKFFSPLGTALVVYRQFEMNYSLSEEVRKILPRSNVDISTNHTQSESNNITNSTNVTTLSETPSTTSSEGQILANSTDDSYNITNSTSVNMNKDEQQLPSLPLNTSDEYDADNTLNIMTFNRLLTKFSTPDQILALIQTKSETYNSTSSVFSKAPGVISDTTSKTKIENNGNKSAEEVVLLNLDSDANSLTPTVSLTQYLYSLFSNIGGSFNNLLGFSPSDANTTKIYTGINYKQFNIYGSAITCLEGIDYFSEMNITNLYNIVECMKPIVNYSTKNCMIKLFDIEHNYSDFSYAPRGCDDYEGLNKIGCMLMSNSCKSIENINPTDALKCYVQMEPKGTYNISDIIYWYQSINCEEQVDPCTDMYLDRQDIINMIICGAIDSPNSLNYDLAYPQQYI